jgi:oxygen-independent coproporphyrinogen-3 oxidase
VPGMLSKSIQADGVYVHVPFCDRICKFCPFNKQLTRSDHVDKYATLLLKEVSLIAQSIAGGSLEFVYLGGGSPSVLKPAQIAKLLDCLNSTIGIQANAEVSVEVHPSHAAPHYLRELRSIGVNRISMGIQSFLPEALNSLGATHSSEIANSAVTAARETFDNMAIDLLYAYHGQTMEDWRFDLSRAVTEYDVPHISCYALVPLAKDYRQPSPTDEIEFAVEAMDFLETHGLYHYASCASGGFDACRLGLECRYEAGHWSAPQKAFLGLGPGAFGFTGRHTTVNSLSTEVYFEALSDDRLPLASVFEVSELELKHRYFSLGVKGLKVPLQPYRDTFGSEPLTDFASQIGRLRDTGLADVNGDFLSLTRSGRLFVDTCSSLFFSPAEAGVPHPEEPEIRILERSVRNQ